MYKTQRMLLALLTSLFTTTVFAQINVNIAINGIEKSLEDNVRLYLSIEQQKDNVLMNEGRLRRLHKKAPQEISRALQPYGYYRPVIDSKITKTTDAQQHKQWQLTYNINPGPPLLIAQFNFSLSEEIQNDTKFQALVKDLALREGSVFSHIEYENIKTSLAKIASERGYFNARFVEHRVEIDLDNYEARIQLNYDGGSRYRFGEMIVRQNIINDELLQRYIPFQKGTPYTLNLLIELQQALNDSDYFQTVEVSPGEAQHDTLEIPINAVLTPRKRHRFSVGLGYGTDTGARAKFGWEIPRLNRRGHRFDADAKVSQLGYSVEAHYRIPVFNPRTDQLVFSSGITRETTDTSESRLRTIGASLKHNRNSWRESITLNYQKEDFIVADDSGVSTLLIPGINWSRTWGKDFIYAVDGLRFDLDLRGASEKVISDTDFFQMQSNIKFITSLGALNRIISRGTLGSTWTQEFHELPTSVRFFAGGAQSVRGYSYHSLGPVDENGNVVGGKYLIIGSLEFERSFKNGWSAAVFYDAGNAINNTNDDLEKGAGFGLRWKSPIGPIRFDLASALSRDGKPWRFHINIGPDL